MRYCGLLTSAAIEDGYLTKINKTDVLEDLFLEFCESAAARTSPSLW